MSTAAEPAVPALDTLTILHRANARLALLRAWLSHSHVDEPYWWARKITVAAAQRERLQLRWVAHVLHVARATAHGRIHGTQFPTLDDQRTWLAQQTMLERIKDGVSPL